MMKGKAGRSALICDGPGKDYFFNIGRGVLSLLAVMLLATPQLAFANGPIVTVNPDSLVIVEEDARDLSAREDTYTIALETEPTEDVTITIVLPGPNPKLSVTSTSTGATFSSDGKLSSFLFTAPQDGVPGNWAEPRKVTVTAGNDDNAVSERVSITHRVTIDGDVVPVRGTTVRVTVQDDDLQNKRVIVTANPNFACGPEATPLPPNLVVPEADSRSYYVRLCSEPTGIVTVEVRGITGEITVSPSRLFITTLNWENDNEVMVFAGEDADAERDKASLTHTVRGADYTGVGAAPVTVEVDDNDMEGVTLSAATMGIVAGGSNIYTVVLDTQPTRTVYVDVELSPADSDVSVRVGNRVGRRLTFPTRNWNVPQRVTVSAPSDASLGTTDLIHTVTESGSQEDEPYDTAPFRGGGGGTENEIRVSVAAASTTGLTLRPTSSIDVDEGATRSYTVETVETTCGGINSGGDCGQSRTRQSNRHARHLDVYEQHPGRRKPLGYCQDH